VKGNASIRLIETANVIEREADRERESPSKNEQCDQTDHDEWCSTPSIVT
jgi:hypothetical protein